MRGRFLYAGALGALLGLAALWGVACNRSHRGSTMGSDEEAAVGDAATDGDANSTPAAAPEPRPTEQLAASPLPDDENPLIPVPQTQACTLPEVPEVGSYRFSSAFPNLTFERPIWVGAAPDTPDTLFVLEQGGRIYAFDERADVTATERSLFLELAPYRDGSEEGLLGIAFHPQYADNGRFFVHYSTQHDCPEQAERCSVLAEYRRSEADPRQAAPEERRLRVIPQPFANHNGGAMAFGPDGYLYFSLGDGGSGGDPLQHGQEPQTLLGSICRIDVDRSSPDLPYAIPADNPFVDGEQGAPEVWAWGLRNVWRFAFDDSTGELWAGDVGQNCYEEVNVLTGPGNYGWNMREGRGCYQGDRCTTDASSCPGAYIDPIWQYGREEGKSITGGLVYRGPEDSLWGAYLFADYGSHQVWALRRQPGEQSPQVTLLGRAEAVTSFGAGRNGRVYLSSLNGTILGLEPADNSEAQATFPQQLSETGCFANLQTLEPAPGVIPYEVNVPFWSDGARKERWVALPAGQSAEVQADGAVKFPVGTVFLKTFFLEVADAEGAQDADDASKVYSERRLETRLLVQQASGYRGFSYRWNVAQTDAELLPGASSESLETPAGTQRWLYPSRVECDQCHTAAAGHVLGFNTRQLDRPIAYHEVAAVDQLAALHGAGYLSDPQGAPAGFSERDGEDWKARAYLDVNCAMCHQPEGPANAQIDLRYSTALVDMGLCGASPGQGDLDTPEAELLRPGQPDRSILHLRMTRRGLEGMPPLASSLPDTEGATAVADWIEQLQQCP